MSTQIPDAIDRLLALFGSALPGVYVADGPQVTFPTARWAVVGGDGAVGEDDQAATSTQQWIGLGALTRDEQIEITCAVGSSTGNAETSMQPRRQDAAEMLQDIEDALRADPGLGGFTTGGAAAVDGITLRYLTNNAGLAAVLVFAIVIPVRSTTT